MRTGITGAGEAVCVPVPQLVDLSVPPRIRRIGRSRLPGNVTQTYGNDEFWSLHLYSNEGIYKLCGETVDLRPGSITTLPIGERAEYTTGEPLEHVFVHIELASGQSASGRLPIHVPPCSESAEAALAIERALEVHRLHSAWACAKIWDAVHGLSTCVRLADESERSDELAHPALQLALSYIDLNLPNRITLSMLASAAGVSATHLNRLFKDRFQRGAMGYLRDLRMEMAHYLLASTAIPVKEVAYQVGIPDIHAFNKLCKSYFGAPPTRTREWSHHRSRR